MNDSFELIESILWHNRYAFLEQHIDRLRHSALCFSFQFDELELREQLLYLSSSFKENTVLKVRVLLSENGDYSLSHNEVKVEKNKMWKIAVSPMKTNSKDMFLYHKTTNRTIYEDQYHAFKKSGFDEVVFCNEQEEVTEGSFTNIFCKINNSWVTPDISCGLLPGVYRQELICRLQSKIQIRPIKIDELKLANHIYVCNSVRGCMKVEKIDFAGV